MSRSYRQSAIAFILPHEPPCESCWRPRVDIYRARDGWLIKFDLAGVRREDVEVFAEGRWLTVRGNRRDCLIQEGHQTYSLEISYNSFERTIELPMDLTRYGIQTEFRDGMFLVSLVIKEQQNE